MAGATDQKLLEEDAPAVVRHPGLAEEVYEAILARLTALKIAPGARITVDGLARELSVSQTPIREALGRLEGEGLVVKTHLIGYSAAPHMTRRRFEELYELRLMLEPAIAAIATGRLTTERLDALRAMAGIMSRRRRGDARLRYSAFARQDAIFHDRIAEIAGNELVRRTLEHQHVHFHIFRLVEHSQVTEAALEEHETLLAAFAAGDEAAAEHAMRVHIERSRDRLLSTLD
ncbi:MAG: GntR family transcriptional regulator [Rhizobiaceae bacterium]|nr:GntR family transcriptional regulator [Rhizobiaceae bacterium]